MTRLNGRTQLCRVVSHVHIYFMHHEQRVDSPCSQMREAFPDVRNRHVRTNRTPCRSAVLVATSPYQRPVCPMVPALLPMRKNVTCILFVCESQLIQKMTSVILFDFCAHAVLTKTFFVAPQAMERHITEACPLPMHRAVHGEWLSFPRYLFVVSFVLCS